MRFPFLPSALAATALLAACGAPDPDRAPADPAAPPPAATPAAGGGGLLRADIEAATALRAPAAPPAATPDAGTVRELPDPALVRLQVLLDRTAFSPGVIDGYHGENTRQAVHAYREARGMGGGDTIDAALIQALAAEDAAPVTAEYVLTAGDLAGPFSPKPDPGDMAAQARDGVHYADARERIAERFHIDEDLLGDLNPGVDFTQAGQRILVPAVAVRPLPQVARIDILKSEKAVRAYDASGTLVAFYPATIGSTDNPTPEGEMTVNGVARNPDYTYDPRRLSYGPGGRRVVIPPGPNNPVGAVWIDLSRDTYGIHGTPNPSLVGKTASHGCVRLTNWDAQQLAAAVKPGVKVRFV